MTTTNQLWWAGALPPVNREDLSWLLFLPLVVRSECQHGWGSDAGPQPVGELRAEDVVSAEDGVPG